MLNQLYKNMKCILPVLVLLLKQKMPFACVLWWKVCLVNAVLKYSAEGAMKQSYTWFQSSSSPMECCFDWRRERLSSDGGPSSSTPIRRVPGSRFCVRLTGQAPLLAGVLRDLHAVLIHAPALAAPLPSRRPALHRGAETQLWLVLADVNADAVLSYTGWSCVGLFGGLACFFLKNPRLSQLGM